MFSSEQATICTAICISPKPEQHHAFYQGTITSSKEAGWKFTLSSLTSSCMNSNADLSLILVFVEISLGKKKAANRGNLMT
ncbi:2186_t:CDS:2 [Diversispora eburnea]|uniref:2186_t:CDS:1 n=1 Tax=Diversispora eburnea TaxID=1213867 RepID=A0A9N8W845_9GLOM|nr:2186_t:CDS:2 [Diversispora eburnea]